MKFANVMSHNRDPRSRGSNFERGGYSSVPSQ